jgi:outer membrane lipoprotein LolB
MSKKICLVFFISWVSILASCATLQNDPPSHYASLTQLQKTLKQIQDWKIKGSISISHNGRTDIASLTWIQSGKQTYMITLAGPLSLGATRIVGYPGHVILWKSKKEKYTAKTPEQLMQTRLGWQIPMSNMYYWVRGLPAPGMSAKTSYDDAHHLVHLNQQGWDVQYLDYTTVNGVELPRKMVLVYPDLLIKFVIKQWKFQY